MHKNLNRIQEWMQRDTHLSYRKFVGTFTIAALALAIFNIAFISGTGSGTTPSIYMQNGVINATTINMNGNLTFNGNNRTDAVANPIGPCSYIVDVWGSTGARMMNQTTGQDDYHSMNATAVINNAFGNLTSGRTSCETVLTKGNLTGLSGTILIPEYATLLIDGSLKQADNQNCPLIGNAVTGYCRYISIVGQGIGIIDGNYANQAVEHRLISINGSASYNYPLTIRDLEINNVYGYALVLSLVNCATVTSVKTLTNCLGGLYLTAGSTDNDFIGCTWNAIGASAYRAVYLSYSCASNRFVSPYIGGGYYGMEINGADNNVITNSMINDCSHGGIVIDDSGSNYASGNSITGGRIAANGYYPVDGTYSDILLSGHTSNTTINGVTMIEGPSHFAKYGVEETGSSDHNTVTGCVFYDQVSGPVSLVGAHSVWMQTEWYAQNQPYNFMLTTNHAGIYYLHNGTIDNVIQTSTNMTYLFNLGINYTESISNGNAGGGSFALGDGEFTMDSTPSITYPGKIRVFGMGSAQTILTQSGSGINVLNITGNGDSSSAYSKSADQVELDHLQLRGGTGYGIYANDTQNLWIHDVAIRYTNYYIFVDHCQYATFKNIIGQNSKVGGVRLFGTSGWSGHYTFERCEFEAKADNAWCFEIYENGQHLDRVTLDSMQLWADSAYSNTTGLWIHGATPASVAVTGVDVLGSTNFENCANATLIESTFRSIVMETPDFYGGGHGGDGVYISSAVASGTITLRQPHFNSVVYGIASYGTPTIVMSDPIWVTIGTADITGTTPIHDPAGFHYNMTSGDVLHGDLLHGLTPTNATWSYWNNNNAYTCDNNFDTYGYGYNNVTSSGGTIGLLTWDLGANYTVLFGETCGVWANASSVNGMLSWSYDGINFYTSSNTDFAKSGTTLQMTEGQACLIYARYIQMKFTTGGANESANIRVYEVHAIIQPNW